MPVVRPFLDCGFPKQVYMNEVLIRLDEVVFSMSSVYEAGYLRIRLTGGGSGVFCAPFARIGSQTLKNVRNR